MRGGMWVALGVFVACGGPDTMIDEMCGPNGTCPMGFECRQVDRRCIRIVAPSIDAAPPAADAAAPACPPAGGPTMHATGAVNGEETWTAATRPHIVVVDHSITGTLILEPCVEVRLGAGRAITVREGGTLRAEGTEARPISIAGDAATPFARIRGLGGVIR